MMAAFSSSFQHLDASSSSSSLVFLQNPNSSSSSTSINNMCALFHHPNNALLSHNFHQHNNTTIIINEVKNDTGSSSPINTAAPNKNSMDSSVSQLTPKNNLLLLPLNKKKRKSNPPSSSSPNSAQSKDMREVKGKKQKKVKECKEKKGGEEEETPKDYIHVRARRGQATDSHSLAERVRRERISERMKLLQALVPGCDKVTGKALMLDEIINYVQSLQNQVEFLSMKLACVNPILYDFGMDMESFMVGDQNLVMQDCSPTASNAYHGLANNNNNNSVNSLLFHQFQIPQGDRQALWEVDEKIINQSEISNNLFSFPLM